MLTPLAEAELHSTPNATMRRYPTRHIAMWRTEMAPGASGPLHALDKPQTVVVIEGRLTATIDGVEHVAGEGDAVTVPAHAARRFANREDSALVLLSAAQRGGRAQVEDNSPVPVPWME